MKYSSAFPFFPKKEINSILEKTKCILEGKSMLSMGQYVKEFEEKFAKYCNVNYAISTNSCTSALRVALKSLGLKKTDEVIIPAQTFFANLSSVVNIQAIPVVCDVDENFLFDYKSIKKLISNNTKAVVVVHFAGLISEDIFRLRAFLKKRNIALIEDCSHAHGAIATDKNGNKFKAGSIGDIGCFSFFSTKVMTTAEGGAIICNDEKIANFCKSYRNRGIDCKEQGENFIYYGENFRFTDFAALLGLSQLSNLEKFLNHRNKIANIYKEELLTLEEKNIISFQKIPSNFRHSYWRFIVFLHKHNPKQIIQKLKDNGINADAPYYPLIHNQPILNTHKRLKKADKLSLLHICLPIHLKINKKDAKIIAKQFKGALQ